MIRYRPSPSVTSDMCKTCFLKWMGGGWKVGCGVCCELSLLLSSTFQSYHISKYVSMVIPSCIATRINSSPITTDWQNYVLLMSRSKYIVYFLNDLLLQTKQIQTSRRKLDFLDLQKQVDVDIILTHITRLFRGEVIVSIRRIMTFAGQLKIRLCSDLNKWLIMRSRLL